MGDLQVSDLVVPLDCPNCERQVLLLSYEITEAEVIKIAAPGYKTAIVHLKENSNK